MYKRDSEIIRADFYLRTEFPHIRTQIFCIKKGFYQIFVENYFDSFDELKNKFDKQIRPITTPVQLTDMLPANSLYELNTINDNKIAQNFAGIPFNTTEMKNLLTVKFPEVDFVHVEGNNGDFKIKVYIKPIENESLINNLSDFLDSLEEPVPIELIDDPSIVEEIVKKVREDSERLKELKKNNQKFASALDHIDNPVLNIFPVKNQMKSTPFEDYDETFWFENIDAIYHGDVTKDNITTISPELNYCYLDYAGFQNVNIRNGVLLYDKVYIEPPIDRTIDYFCKDQKIRKDELFELCKTGRVAFALTQPSFRYDINFFNEIYKENSNSILSRRALSALILADLVEINKDYIFNNTTLIETIDDLSRLISETNSIEYDFLYNTLIWPIKALRQSFNTMLWGSTKKVASFGVNQIFHSISAIKNSSNLDFEFTMNSEKVHISNSLNSFYFPFFDDNNYTNRPYASRMRSMLNLYKYMTTERMNNYIKTKNDILSSTQELNPIDIIEVNEFYSLQEINECAKSLYTGSNFNSLISLLANLPKEERDKKISEYNSLVREQINKNKKRKTAVDFGISAGVDAAGLFIPFLGTGLKVLDFSSKKLNVQNIEKIERIKEAFMKFDKDNIDDKRVVSFLAKVNPVARLRYFD